MATWHYLNTDQSGFYVDAVEHVERLKHSNDAKWMGVPVQRMWPIKEAEGMASSGHGSGLYEALVNRNEEVEEPISLVHAEGLTTSPTQIDGHHRAAIAAAKQRKLGRQVRVPVEYMHPNHFGLNHMSAALPQGERTLGPAPTPPGATPSIPPSESFPGDSVSWGDVDPSTWRAPSSDIWDRSENWPS